VPSWLWTKFTWASSKRTWLVVLDITRLSELQASSKGRVTRSYWNLVAKANQTSLKRAELFSATFDFSLRALGDQSELPKMFLLTCLITVYTSNPIGTSFEVKLDTNLWNELNFWKMSKNANFAETCVSQVNDVGLSMYAVYVVTKNGLDLFHWELNCFALKMDSIWKSGIMRRTLWIMRFLGS